MTDERSRWNARHAERTPLTEPAGFLVRQASTLPSQGRALDVAGGTGRKFDGELALAARGWPHVDVIAGGEGRTADDHHDAWAVVRRGVSA